MKVYACCLQQAKAETQGKAKGFQQAHQFDQREGISEWVDGNVVPSEMQREYFVKYTMEGRTKKKRKK